jgi:hypothetical protein
VKIQAIFLSAYIFLYIHNPLYIKSNYDQPLLLQPRGRTSIPRRKTSVQPTPWAYISIMKVFQQQTVWTAVITSASRENVLQNRLLVQLHHQICDETRQNCAHHMFHLFEDKQHNSHPSYCLCRVISDEMLETVLMKNECPLRRILIIFVAILESVDTVHMCVTPHRCLPRTLPVWHSCNDSMIFRRISYKQVLHLLEHPVEGWNFFIFCL